MNQALLCHYRKPIQDQKDNFSSENSDFRGMSLFADCPHFKWGRAENHTHEYRHQQSCSVCLDPHEDVSLYGGFCDFTVESRDFILHCWFCGDVRESKVYNAWIVIYYSVFLGIGCVFLAAGSPDNLGFIFWSIFISNHIIKDAIHCFVFSDKFLLLLPNAFGLLLKKWCTW